MLVMELLKSMKFFETSTVRALLILLVLVLSGWPLLKDAKTIRQRRAYLESLRATNLSLKARVFSGVDVNSHLLLRERGLKSVYIAFLARYDTLAQDLAFWNRVAEIVSTKGRDFVFIGYCDDRRCHDEIKGAQQSRVSILEFGDTMTLQAIVNADSEGKALLSAPNPINSTALLWRTGGISPNLVAQEVLR